MASGGMVAMWLRGEPTGDGPLRERQWLRPASGGEILAMPPCLMRGRDARAWTAAPAGG